MDISVSSMVRIALRLIRASKVKVILKYIVAFNTNIEFYDKECFKKHI